MGHGVRGRRGYHVGERDVYGVAGLVVRDAGRTVVDAPAVLAEENCCRRGRVASQPGECPSDGMDAVALVERGG